MCIGSDGATVSDTHTGGMGCAASTNNNQGAGPTAEALLALPSTSDAISADVVPKSPSREEPIPSGRVSPTSPLDRPPKDDSDREGSPPPRIDAGTILRSVYSTL